MKRTLTEQQKKTLSVLAIVIFVLLSAALAWFVGRPMVRFARQPEQFRAWVDGHGAWGPLAYVAMVFLQVLVAHYPRRAAGDRRGYAFGAWAGTALCLLGAVLGSVTVFALVRPLGPRSGGGVLPGGQAGKAPISPPYLPQAHRPVLADLHRSRYAQGPAVLLRGPDGPAVGDLAADRHSGPPALHRHLHRGRQRPGGAELPGGAVIAFALALAVAGVGYVIYRAVCRRHGQKPDNTKTDG